jgi:hypothetical protein
MSVVTRYLFLLEGLWSMVTNRVCMNGMTSLTVAKT